MAGNPPSVPTAISVFGARVHNLKNIDLKNIDVEVPLGKFVAVAGVSGSGKTTLVLEALVPALRSLAEDTPLPAPVTSIDARDARRVVVVDASPIGSNVHSTVAAYSGVMDELRRSASSSPRTWDATSTGPCSCSTSPASACIRWACASCSGSGTGS